MKYMGMNCKLFVYDEERGAQKINLKPGTKVEDILDTYRCSVCGASRSYLQPVSDDAVSAKRVPNEGGSLWKGI